MSLLIEYVHAGDERPELGWLAQIMIQLSLKTHRNRAHSLGPTWRQPSAAQACHAAVHTCPRLGRQNAHLMSDRVRFPSSAATMRKGTSRFRVSTRVIPSRPAIVSRGATAAGP